MGFFMTVLMTTLGKGIFVIRPILDVLALKRVFNFTTYFEKDRKSFRSRSIKVFSVSSLGRDGEDFLLGK